MIETSDSRQAGTPPGSITVAAIGDLGDDRVHQRPARAETAQQTYFGDARPDDAFSIAVAEAP